MYWEFLNKKENFKVHGIGFIFQSLQTLESQKAMQHYFRCHPYKQTQCLTSSLWQKENQLKKKMHAHHRMQTTHIHRPPKWLPNWNLWKTFNQNFTQLPYASLEKAIRGEKEVRRGYTTHRFYCTSGEWFRKPWKLNIKKHARLRLFVCSVVKSTRFMKKIVSRNEKKSVCRKLDSDISFSSRMNKLGRKIQCWNKGYLAAIHFFSLPSQGHFTCSPFFIKATNFEEVRYSRIMYWNIEAKMRI